MLRKLVVELIGTFFLVFTIGHVLIGTEGTAVASLAPFAIASVLMVMIYAGGHISGAHYNPAVTIAVWIRGRAEARELLPYCVAQIAGALLTVPVLMYLKGDVVAVAAELPALPTILAEFIFTFGLVFVVLNVATARGTEGNSNYGLAIGFTVLSGIFAVGGVSGGVFNPAVAIGVTTMGMSAVSNLLPLIMGELLGAVCAGMLFNGLDLGDDKALHLEAASGGVASAASTADGPTS